MKALLVATLLVASSTAPLSWGMTIDEAYQSIPHKRTPYNSQVSALSLPEREFLSRFFALSDQALVERVATLAAFRAGDRQRFTTYEANASRILAELRTLPEPPSARGFVPMLSEAIQQQHLFFQKWDTALAEQRSFAFPTGTATSGVDPNVGKASAELRRLYANLMARYATEHARNREAFYQHLCALDFL
jgi:hypothetical protein